MPKAPDYKGEPVEEFATLAKWEQWLAKNHSKSTGLWVRLYKKASGKKSTTYDDILDGALAFGWIDGQKQSYDEVSWLQRFSPRRAKGLWSKRNIEHIARLTKAKKMRPSGIAQVESAKADGRWAAAYDAPGSATVPTELVKALAKNKKAKAFYDTLNKANTYAITWRLQTAKKPETKHKRLEAILKMLENGEKFH